VDPTSDMGHCGGAMWCPVWWGHIFNNILLIIHGSVNVKERGNVKVSIRCKGRGKRG